MTALPLELEDRDLDTSPIPALREQVDLERAFAGSVIVATENALKYCQWLEPGNLTQLRIRKFWQLVRDEKVEAMQAAIQSECWPDIIGWNNLVINSYQADEIAREIQARAWLATLDPVLAQLIHARQHFKLAQVQSLIQQLAAQTPILNENEIPDSGDATIELNCLLNEDMPRVINTFVPRIDYAIGGLEIGNVSILASRPSMGKSTLAFQIARNVAASELSKQRAGLHMRPVLYFSLEQKRIDLWLKAACGLLSIPARDVLAKRIGEETRQQLIEVGDQLAEAYGEALRIEDRRGLSMSAIWKRAAHYRPCLVIVDALGMIQESGERRQDRLNQAIQTAAQAADDMECAFLLIHHVNRDSVKNENHIPTMADLADCGDLEKYAQQILLLHSDHYYETGEVIPDKLTVKALVAKNRLGPRSVEINLILDNKRQWFEETPASKVFDGKEWV